MAGINVPVIRGSARALPVEVRGSADRLFNGTIQSSEHAPKRVYRCALAFASNSDLTVFLEAVSVLGSVGIPTPVPVSSPADGLTRGASITAHVRAEDAEAVYTEIAGVGSAYWRVPLTIRET